MVRKIRTVCAACKKDIHQMDLVIESDGRGIPKHTYHRKCVILQSDKKVTKIVEREKKEKDRQKEESNEPIQIEVLVAQ